MLLKALQAWLHTKGPASTVNSYEVLQQGGRHLNDFSQWQLKSLPNTSRLASLALGYLALPIDICVESTQGQLCRQVLLSLASLDPEKLSAKSTLGGFNSTTLRFMLEFTSPCKLEPMNSNMNLGVLEAASVKFAPFLVELHQSILVIFLKLWNALKFLQTSCRYFLPPVQ